MSEVNRQAHLGTPVKMTITLNMSGAIDSRFSSLTGGLFVG